MIASDSFGDVMRIRKKKQNKLLQEGGCINFEQDGSDEEMKSEDNNQIKVQDNDIWEDETYVLHSVQKSKFSRQERVHILKQAAIVIALEQK